MFFMLIQALKHTGFCGCKGHSLLVNGFKVSTILFCKYFLLALNRASLFAKKDCQRWPLLTRPGELPKRFFDLFIASKRTQKAFFLIHHIFSSTQCHARVLYQTEKKRELCRIFRNQVSRSPNSGFVKHTRKLQRYPHIKRLPIRASCLKFVRQIIISLPILRLEDFPGLYSLQCWQKTQAGSSEEEMVYKCKSAPKMSVINQLAFKLT